VTYLTCFYGLFYPIPPYLGGDIIMHFLMISGDAISSVPYSSFVAYLMRYEQVVARYCSYLALRAASDQCRL
jgi:hypothetical protein